MICDAQLSATKSQKEDIQGRVDQSSDSHEHPKSLSGT